MRTYVTQSFIMAATIFVICFLAIVAIVRKETFESHYHSLDVAVADRAIERGWIPSWLPNSAKQIWEIHDIDSNRVYIAFRYDTADQNWFSRPCAQLAQVPQNPNPRVDWWLTSKTGQDSWPSHVFFSCANRNFGYDFYLAIDPINRHAYLWSFTH